eukprot:scaffold1423_cov314-Prasinococcus_capsulatus_cf.AAC.2
MVLVLTALALSTSVQRWNQPPPAPGLASDNLMHDVLRGGKDACEFLRHGFSRVIRHACHMQPRALKSRMVKCTLFQRLARWLDTFLVYRCHNRACRPLH